MTTGLTGWMVLKFAVSASARFTSKKYFIKKLRS